MSEVFNMRPAAIFLKRTLPSQLLFWVYVQLLACFFLPTRCYDSQDVAFPVEFVTVAARSEAVSKHGKTQPGEGTPAAVAGQSSPGYNREEQEITFTDPGAQLLPLAANSPHSSEEPYAVTALQRRTSTLTSALVSSPWSSFSEEAALYTAEASTPLAAGSSLRSSTELEIPTTGAAFKTAEASTPLGVWASAKSSVIVEPTTLSLRASTGWKEQTTLTSATAEDRPAQAEAGPELHVVGLFSLTGSHPVGLPILIGAQLAVDDVNSRPDVLAGYTLVLDAVDERCDIAIAMDQLYRKIFTESTKIMVLGATCSHVTEQTAHASRTYNMVQISSSALTPTLSGKDYSWFFRVLASEAVLSHVRVKMIQHFGWKLVTFIHGPQSLFLSTMDTMRNAMKEINVTNIRTLPFERNPADAIRDAKNSDARIIFLSAYDEDVLKAICSAYWQDFYGPHIVWILPSFFEILYTDSAQNCTMEQNFKVVDGYLSVANIHIAEDTSARYDGVGINSTLFFQHFKEKVRKIKEEEWKNASDFKDKMAAWEEMVQDFNGDRYIMRGQERTPLAYDAMWAIALALNASLSQLVANGHGSDALKYFTYTNRTMGELIRDSMRRTRFRGISGEITFSDTGDRIPAIAIRQFRVRNVTSGDVYFETVGVFINSTMHFISEPLWAGSGRRPYDSRQVRRSLKLLPLSLYAVTCAAAGLGVMEALAFLWFNLRLRRVRMIRMSSPNINNLILAGCLLFFSTVAMEDIRGQRLHFLCHVRLVAMVLGFSLGYGALFAKTWRVYEIITATNKMAKIRKDLSDSRLLITVLCLVAVNMGVVLAWTLVDDFTMVLEDVEDVEDTEEKAEDDVVEISQSLVCAAQHKFPFTLALLSLQGLLLIFGAFLAVQTRKVSVPELNDSRWIGLSIYNVVVLGTLGAILVLGTRQPPHVAYLLESFIIIVGAAVTQSLVFLPKLQLYRKMVKGSLSESASGRLTVRTLSVDSVRSRCDSSASIGTTITLNSSDAGQKY